MVDNSSEEAQSDGVGRLLFHFLLSSERVAKAIPSWFIIAFDGEFAVLRSATVVLKRPAFAGSFGAIVTPQFKSQVA